MKVVTQKSRCQGECFRKTNRPNKLLARKFLFINDDKVVDVVCKSQKQTGTDNLLVETRSYSVNG